MDPIFLNIFGLEIRWYSLIMLIAVIIGIIILIKEGKKFDYPKDFLFNMAFWAVIFGFIGARIYYVIFNYEMYLHDPLSIFKIWEGGLAIHGGIFAGLLTIYLYCHKYQVRILKITDMACISLLLAQAIGRWGNFFNSEAHGGATTLLALQNKHIPEFIIEGMHINGVYYEPTFLYESLWCLLGVIVLLLIRKYKYLKIGFLSGTYLIWYSIGRFFIEAMRTDSLMFVGFKTAQIVSALLCIGGIILIVRTTRKSKFEDLYNEQNGGKIKF